MKRDRNIIILVLFIFLTIHQALADGIKTENIQSLEWQKVELSEKIRKAYDHAISKILSSKKYLVNVKLEANESKLGKKASSKRKDSTSPKDFKFNDQIASKDASEFILMSKLGIEAPLIKDEDNYKRENLKKTISDLNDTFDVFSYLTKLNIEVYLTDKLDQATRKNLEDLIYSVQLNLNTKPTIHIKYISMNEGMVNEKAPVISTLDKLLPWISKFSTAIGMILAVVIIGFVSYSIFKKYSLLQEKKLDLMAKAQKVESKNANQNKGDIKQEGSNSSTGASEISEEESVKAYERFMNHYENHPTESLLLIKKWIKSDEENAKLALNALIKQMENEKLKFLFEKLNIEERKEWKGKLKQNLNDEEIKIGNAFMSEQIIQDIMAPPIIQDADLIKAMNILTPTQGFGLIQKDIELGAVLLNIMNPQFISDLMELLPQDLLTLLVETTARFDEDSIKTKLIALKDNLPKNNFTAKKSPFIENIIKHIEFSKPKTEKILFKTLLANEGHDATLQIAMNFLPAEVTEMVSDKIIKHSLLLFPQQQRISFICSLGEKTSHYLELAAPEGSKSRELFDLEIEKIESDLELKQEIISKKEIFLNQYTSNVRKYVKNNPDALKELKPLIENWINSLATHESNKTTSNDSNSIEDIDGKQAA